MHIAIDNSPLTTGHRNRGVGRYTKLLIDQTAAKPFLMKTFPPERGNPELANAIKELSRLKYGRDREFIEKEIIFRIGA